MGRTIEKHRERKRTCYIQAPSTKMIPFPNYLQNVTMVQTEYNKYIIPPWPIVLQNDCKLYVHIKTADKPLKKYIVHSSFGDRVKH